MNDVYNSMEKIKKGKKSERKVKSSTRNPSTGQKGQTVLALSPFQASRCTFVLFSSGRNIEVTQTHLPRPFSLHASGLLLMLSRHIHPAIQHRAYYCSYPDNALLVCRIVEFLLSVPCGSIRLSSYELIFVKL